MVIDIITLIMVMVGAGVFGIAIGRLSSFRRIERLLTLEQREEEEKNFILLLMLSLAIFMCIAPLRMTH